MQSYGSDIGGIIPERVSIYHGGTGWLLWTASLFIWGAWAWIRERNKTHEYGIR